MMNMHQSGELETVLEGAGALVPVEEAEEVKEGAKTEAGEVVVGQGTVEKIEVVHGEKPGAEKQNVNKEI